VAVIMFRPNGLLPESPIFARARFPGIKPVEDGFAFLGQTRSRESTL